MSKGGYHGGSTLVGPGSRYWWTDPDDRKSDRHIDPELQAIMAEHDALRAQGVDPVIEARNRSKMKKKAARRARAKRVSPTKAT
ncbi:hypothetical protein [Sphingomonas profundi]|uniref:hypothetical protein n=1 Tax=Alterirhizorhabdus profundi TaxID=2681549 RepID=UPI0012E75CD0|nr:hypothetical protein [Sphingomonas profundi]